MDLYIRDDLADTGVEPNLSTAPKWLSPDIWVRTDPLPGWSPAPYPIATPPSWMVPAPVHQDPDYRSPLSGKPNYVYVRIRNRGTASTGTERLQLYWASASTGLSWDPAKVGGSFVDNVQGNVLFGSEITKVRKNAATASQAERDAYIAALRKIAVDPAFVFSNGSRSYWNTQQEIHRFGPPTRHGSGNPTFIPSVSFLPWHREFMNRFEGLLQEANPRVKLLYWNWNDNLRTGPLDFFVNSFMGASGFGQAAGVGVGPSLFPDLKPLYPNPFSGAATVVRRLGNFAATQADAVVVGRSAYDSPTPADNFSGGIESPSHNNAHVLIGGNWNAPGGNNPALLGDQILQPLAARDPLFFLLHAKVDELWARWQRKSVANLHPATTYGTASADPRITSTMGPWNGVAVTNDGLVPGNPLGTIEPWTPLGGQLYAKPGNDRSVTSPPLYDTAPLTIPAMQPNEEVVIEIPWYPPNPASFGPVSDPQHVCLLARIESSTVAPFGMAVPETLDINFNTQQNNNIAWRNVSVVDNFPGAFKMIKVNFRNIFDEPVRAGLILGATLDETQAGFLEHGVVTVDLGEELFARWSEGGQRAAGVELLENDRLRVTDRDAALEGIVLEPGETFFIRMAFELQPDYQPTRPGRPAVYDIVQTGRPGDDTAIVGGQRYQVSTDRLVPVPRGRDWRLFMEPGGPPKAWSTLDFNDSEWYQRRLDLGLVNFAARAHGRVPTAIYFRHAFEVDHPDFFRSLHAMIRQSDGAVVHLNGHEVHRAHMSKGSVSHETYSDRASTAIERDTYFPVKIDPSLLRSGTNILAVEVHRAKDSHADATFDFELAANWDTPEVPPSVRFADVTDGMLLKTGTAARIDIETLDPEHPIQSVTLSVDDEPIGILESAPFTFEWKVEPGPHRLTATVVGNRDLRAHAHATVNGVENIPPAVSITQPSEHAEVAPGSPLEVIAHAVDIDGEVTKVEFWVHDSPIFGDPGRLVGTATSEPFRVTLHDLRSGHNMITAVAHDNEGARTASIPVMVSVSEHEGHSGHGHS